MRLTISIMLFLFYSIVLSDNCLNTSSINSENPSSYISFEDYHIIHAEKQDDMIYRELKVEVKNISNQLLTNVELVINNFRKGWVCSAPIIKVGDIAPGESVIIDSPVMIWHYPKLVEEGKLKLIWRIECSTGTQHIMDIVSVIEHLSD